MNQAMTLEHVLLKGDLSVLSPEQKVSHYHAVCASLNLNPLTKPFEYIKLNGKEVLYAKRDATDQLRNTNNISVNIISREKIEDVFVVTAQATTPNGRCDESVGAVNVSGLKGEPLANALMKAETKAKRRVTLSICGLGVLDETEIETIAQEKEVSRATASIPQALSAHSNDETEPMKCDCGNTMMVSKYNQGEWYCNPKANGCGAKKPRGDA
jgi:hypothetical protein